MFGVSDEILDITRRSGMVRRIRFMYWEALELFRKSPEGFGILWKVAEGSRRKVRKVPGLVGPDHGQPWAHVGRPRQPRRPLGSVLVQLGLLLLLVFDYSKRSPSWRGLLGIQPINRGEEGGGRTTSAPPSLRPRAATTQPLPLNPNPRFKI